LIIYIGIATTNLPTSKHLEQKPHVMREIDSHFDAYEHLKHLPREQEALHMLRKAASAVKPMMRKRGWKVGSLAEFLPDEPQLLGP
jgi:hypothetical protein